MPDATNESGDPVVEDLAVVRRQIADLETALRSARVIGMAMGILTVQRSLTEDTASTMLQHLSRTTNRKVRDRSVSAPDHAFSGERGLCQREGGTSDCWRLGGMGEAFRAAHSVDP